MRLNTADVLNMMHGRRQWCNIQSTERKPRQARLLLLSKIHFKKLKRQNKAFPSDIQKMKTVSPALLLTRKHFFF